MAAEGRDQEAVISPVFFLHSHLGLDKSKHIAGYEVIKNIQAVVDKEDIIDGIQRIGGLWRLYIADGDEKIKLLSEGFTYNGIAVSVMAENPFLRKQNEQEERQRGTKVIVQNVPLSIPNTDVEEMLKQFDVKMLSNIAYEYEKDDNRQLTKIKNGNRSVYMDTERLEATPLPRFSLCGNWRCRIQYRGQPMEIKYCYRCHREGHISRDCRNQRACSVCHKEGHLEGSEDCSAYAPNDCVTFKGERDVLSNFFPCTLIWKGAEYPSAEHIYQAEKAVMNNRPDIAAEIVGTETALEAKKVGKKVYTKDNWEVENQQLMYKVLENKVNQLKVVRDTLLSKKDEMIVEAVPYDYLWGSGLTKTATRNTDPSKWPGKNMLGQMWMSIREELEQEIDINSQSSKDRKEKRKDRSSDSDVSNENPVSRPRLTGSTPDKCGHDKQEARNGNN